MRRGRYVAAAGVLAVLVVGACSHNSGGQSAAGLAVTDDSGAGGSGSGAVGENTNALGRNAAHVPAATASAPALRPDSATAAQLTDTSSKIRVAYLKVAVKGAAHVAAQADAADAIATQAGGEVDADDRTSGRHASATLELRVPPATLQATLSQLARLGHELGRQLSTTDVTQQVADVSSRIISARDSIARLRVLYANAQKVRDVIQIEDELSSREASLESLQARQRSLARQTSLATINLTLVTASKKQAAAAKPAKKRGGFLGGLERGWDGFTAAAVWVASAVGTLLPFVALLLLLALAVRRWGLPRRRPTPAPRPSE